MNAIISNLKYCFCPRDGGAGEEVYNLNDKGVVDIIGKYYGYLYAYENRRMDIPKSFLDIFVELNLIIHEVYQM